MPKFAKIAKIGTLILVSRETKAPMIKLLMSTARWPLDLSTKRYALKNSKSPILVFPLSSRGHVTAP